MLIEHDILIINNDILKSIDFKISLLIIMEYNIFGNLTEEEIKNLLQIWENNNRNWKR
jgi:hypothetical protein